MEAPTVSRWQIVTRGLTNRCPNCGGRPIFRAWFKLCYRCPRCAMKMARSDGFFLGAVVWNYGLTVFGCLPLLLALYAAGVISLTTLGLIGATVGVVVPAVIYPWAWSLWLMTYYWALPHELPANAGTDPNIDEDE
ncbi:hypothetical protein [Cerasicoccus fimbriatus]|uniref:hypothetical protein n=1 Tax=Cerasicoccus fimbriatus TaxID=3014554 RepID=UPI0022B5A5E6|nr:hypothetical protein [Cerasicoccus sp. TK19100]